jgi:hypothetical protein
MRAKFIIALLALIIVSCTTFHSRMFLKQKPEPPVNGLVINPTMVAFQNNKDRYKDYDIDNDYWVELSISDTITSFPRRLLDVPNTHKDLARVRSHFRKRVMQDFAVDTVIINLLPANEEHKLAFVKDIPGWKWELKYRFGSIPIAADVESLLVTIPYRTFDSTGAMTGQDTMTFSMKRYESHRKETFAPDIPGSYEEYQQEMEDDKKEEE